MILLLLSSEGLDVLNVRAGPSIAQDIIAKLDPLASNVVATGGAGTAAVSGGYCDASASICDGVSHSRVCRGRVLRVWAAV